MLATDGNYLRLDGAKVTLVLDLTDEHVPQTVYWGPKLDDDTDLDTLGLLAATADSPATPHRPQALPLLTEIGRGFPGEPGIRLHRQGEGFATAFEDAAAMPEDDGSLAIVLEDSRSQLFLAFTLIVHDQHDMLEIRSRLENRGSSAVTVDFLASAMLPVPHWASEALSFEGRWAQEFSTKRTPLGRHLFERSSRAGRPGHDGFPALVLGKPGFDDTEGTLYSFHLGWSGNHRIFSETLTSGQRLAGAGAMLLPGELRLGPGQKFETPPLYATVTEGGLNGLMEKTHSFVRDAILPRPLNDPPRKVHFNSWEACYFDQSVEKLSAMADDAAALGAERFVLDDGWFENRRDDTKGLGDWRADPGIFPDGLDPLIAHIKAKGMDFGLWVEPEMVNPNSKLYRAHPDWVLGIEGIDQPHARNQLALDFSRSAVRDYMIEMLDGLLSAHDIAYLKWDMNRDLTVPGGPDGRAAAHAHTLGLYEVLDTLRAKHPAVEIESCASGGGRADWGMLKRTERVWVSDGLDAQDRAVMQHGFGLFFPPEVMGSHIGAARNAITGRTQSVSFRAAVALQGHMGLELDPAALSEGETAQIKSAIALYKEMRPHLTTARTHHLECGAEALGVLRVTEKRDQAWLSYLQLASHGTTVPAPLLLTGLDPAKRYRMTLIVPDKVQPYGHYALGEAGLFGSGVVIPGDQLMQAGVPLPFLQPAMALMFALKAE